MKTDSFTMEQAREVSIIINKYSSKPTKEQLDKEQRERAKLIAFLKGDIQQKQSMSKSLWE